MSVMTRADALDMWSDAALSDLYEELETALLAPSRIPELSYEILSTYIVVRWCRTDFENVRICRDEASSVGGPGAHSQVICALHSPSCYEVPAVPNRRSVHPNRRR